MRGVDHALPTIQQVIDRNIEDGKLTNPDIQCVGICVNTQNLPEDEARDYLSRLADEYGLPCVDPIRTGMAPIVDEIQKRYPS